MPPITTVPLRRQFDQYFLIVPNKRRLRFASSSYKTISDEIWSNLKHYSEIREKGIELAKANGIANLNEQRKAWLEFRAYIRQAESYYRIAQETPTRSAALLYYYCFLNLIKGGLRIKYRRPFASMKPKHGLYFDTSRNTQFELLTVKPTSGIFSIFYKDYYGKPIPQRPFNLTKLLGYCSDVGTQFEIGGYGALKIHGIFFASCSLQSAHESWGLLGIENGALLRRFKSSMKQFYERFELVDVPQAEYKEVFDLNAWAANNFSFFQSKNPHPWPSPSFPCHPAQISNEAEESLTDLIRPNLFGERPMGFIYEPYLTHNQTPIDELCAIYMIMFSLSNLVRYNPSYLEGLLESTSAWMVENFIQYTPETFIRAILGWIINHDYIYMHR